MKLNTWIKLIALSIILYSIFILIFGIYDFKESILLIPFYWWLFAIFFTSTSHFILSIRWNYYLNYLNHSLTFVESSKIYLAGLSLMAAPARSGEAIRSIWLSRRHGIPLSIGTGITISERIGELFSAILVIAWSLNSLKIIYISVILLLIISFIPRFFKMLIYSFIKNSINLIPITGKYLSKEKLIIEISATLQKVKSLFNSIPFLISIFLCTIVWIIESFLLYKIFSTLNVDITLKQSLLIRTLMGIGGVISLLPGGLLTSETTSIALSIAYGSGKIEAFAATLFIRIYTLFLPSLIGLVALLLQKDLDSSSKDISVSS
tara:strand:- start:455 stop:1417 length:963 start_codon:yes stop_codon:yes gene_type:complete